MAPQISVILPTFNRAGTIERSVESILAQTFEDFELIIIDDGSTDGTAERIQSVFSDRRMTLIRQSHAGVSSARNTGIRYSKGRYIAFQDSDDEALPGKLERAVATLDASDPAIGVFYSDMLEVKAHQRCDYWHSPHIDSTNLIDEETLDYKVHGLGILSAVVRRDHLNLAGKFDEKLIRFSDLDMFIRLSSICEFHHHREALVKYHSYGVGIHTDSKALVDARLRLLQKYSARIWARLRYAAGQYVAISDAYLAVGQPRRALTYALKAWMLHPPILRFRDRVAPLFKHRCDIYIDITIIKLKKIVVR